MPPVSCGFPLALLCLLLVTIAATADNENQASRHRFYGSSSVGQPRTVQYHRNSPAKNSQRLPNYFEEIKQQPKRINSPARKPETYRHEQPIKSVISSYFPIDFDEPKLIYPIPATKPVIPTYYRPKEEPVKPLFYPALPVKPDYDVEAPYSDYCPKMGGLESHCRPASDCAVWYDLVLNYLPESACKLANGAPGSCCPDIPSNGIY